MERYENITGENFTPPGRAFLEQFSTNNHFLVAITNDEGEGFVQLFGTEQEAQDFLAEGPESYPPSYSPVGLFDLDAEDCINNMSPVVAGH